MTAPDRQRDGGPFTAGAMCPHCHVCDVHPIREPNRTPPVLVDQAYSFVCRRSGGCSGDITYITDRWDERPFDVIRTCTSCGYEWGQR